MELLEIFVAVSPPSLAIVFAVSTWFLKHRSKENSRRVRETEKRYRALLDSLDGFSITADEAELIENTKLEKQREFIRLYTQCWLYSPDSVIKAMNGFLDSVSAGNNRAEEARQSALRECVLTMRKELFTYQPLRKRRSELIGEDFRFLRPN